jgi:hypothetical protein
MMTQQGGQSSQGSQEQKYLTERWQPQREYYSRQSKINKRWHQWMLTFSAVGAVVVPVLLNISQIPGFVPTVISFMISIAIALDNIFHFGDNWKAFRQAGEALKQERIFFDNRLDHYSDPNTALSVFIKRCEAIMSSEGKYYFEVHKPGDRSPDGLTL